MTDSLLAGPPMIDIAGTELTGEDRELIAQPQVSGVILFARNYRDRGQLKDLVGDIRRSCDQPLLIAVDQEGGRVQRFRDGFTRIPPMRSFGDLYDEDPLQALVSVRHVARVLAWELRCCDIDFSFAPVLDIDHDAAGAIGDRAFHKNTQAVIDLAGAVIGGFSDAGCASVAKHFPGHGSVSADTHVDFATDTRPFGDIYDADMLPFRKLIGAATAVMPAHVVYSACDSEPASLSAYWQKTILRQKLGFDGPIISDDMSMAAVMKISSQAESAVKAVLAGTDLVLICNDRDAAVAAIETPALPLGDADNLRRRQLLQPASVQAPAADILAEGSAIAESLTS